MNNSMNNSDLFIMQDKMQSLVTLKKCPHIYNNNNFYYFDYNLK